MANTQFKPLGAKEFQVGIQIQGNGGAIAEVDGTTFRAQRVSPRPVDHGTLGAYAYGGFTGILPAALAANRD